MKIVENIYHIIRGKCVIASLSLTYFINCSFLSAGKYWQREYNTANITFLHYEGNLLTNPSSISFLLLWCSILAMYLYISSIHRNIWMTMPLIYTELEDSFLSCRVTTYVDFLFVDQYLSLPTVATLCMMEMSSSNVLLHSNVFLCTILVLVQIYFSSTQNICFDYCTISLFYMSPDNLYGDHMLSHNLNNSRDELVYDKFSHLQMFTPSIYLWLSIKICASNFYHKQLLQ